MDKVLVLKATENGTVGVEMPFDKEAGLDFYYQNLDCDTIDIVEAHGLVELKLEDFCLVCDDEGIFLRWQGKWNCIFAVRFHGTWSAVGWTRYGVQEQIHQ